MKNETQQKISKYKQVKKEFTFWLPFEPGDFVQGEITGKFKGQYGEQFIILNEDDKLSYCMPNHAVINSLMDGMKKGDSVRVVYTGEKDTPKGTKMKLYEVYLRENTE